LACDNRRVVYPSAHDLQVALPLGVLGVGGGQPLGNVQAGWVKGRARCWAGHGQAFGAVIRRVPQLKTRVDAESFDRFR